MNNNLRRMNLKEVQDVGLEILIFLDSFCRKHNIKYSLTYGSLIGAVRHKGFIPWDDDIDVMMLRDDYERFCELWVDNDDYKLFCPQRKNIFTPLSRICEMKKTLCIPRKPLFTESTGLWIDIFPIDYVEQDNIMDNPLYQQLIKLTEFTIKKRTSMYSWKRSGFNISKQVWLLIKKLIYRGNIHDAIQQYDTISKSFGDKNSKFICILTIVSSINRKPVPKYLFSNVINLKFEGKPIQVLSGYHEYLTKGYGDYMKLPPVEKRVPGHSMHDYYWRNID